MTRLTVVLLILWLLAGCDSPLLKPAPIPLGERLTGAQVKSALAGNSLVRIPEEVPPLAVYFSEGGDLRGLRANHYSDTGTWRVEDDTLCGAWKDWYGTLSQCWEVYRAGDTITLKRSDHVASFRATIHPGNAADRR